MSEPEHVDPKDSVLRTSIYRCKYDIIRGRMDHEDGLIRCACWAGEDVL